MYTHGIARSTWRPIVALGFFSFILFVSACSLVNNISIPTHGNFCGPNHPNVNTGSQLKDLIELIQIPPSDDLDAACQRHDICYAINYYFSTECDVWFLGDVNNLQFSTLSQEQKSFCDDTKKVILESGRMLAGGVISLDYPDADGNLHRRPLPSILGIINNIPMRAPGSILSAPILFGENMNYRFTNNLKCNQSDGINFSDPWYQYTFDAQLIEILKYKGYISDSESVLLRSEIINYNRNALVRQVDPNWSYKSVAGETIDVTMKKWAHPVLHGAWNLQN
ncbi:hypothetical protein [Defluviicoccus vanus]|uniref:Uncharacterized protein n=1 Tax=Defluviicoccus vanus TaxID=111831 RepID=A0A7H1N1E4_9PROT|nr:hypothetical protein [Defluviicoccus vanus]QNT69530.1 hypothetical protein HQ394_09530 [Defluviicoccus vanus]